MSFDTALHELGDLVHSPEFKQKNVEYFDRFCAEFTDDEENKLVYTTIHNEYQQMVEDTVQQSLGPEKFQVLCGGLLEYVNSGRSLVDASEKASDAVDVLHSATDFKIFKTVMISKRNAIRAGKQTVGEFRGALDIEEAITRAGQLAQAASDADGWQTLVDEDGLKMMAKPQEGGSGTFLRYTMAIPLPLDQAVDCMVNFTPESLNWRERVKDMKTMKVFSPDDLVVSYCVDMPALVTWAMGIPDVMHLRIAKRSNWPSPGEHAYACVPYDMENDVCMESMGPMKIKTGIMSAHPNDPLNQTMLTGSDLVDLPSMMPNFALALLIKKTVPAQMTAMSEKYKAFRSGPATVQSL